MVKEKYRVGIVKYTDHASLNRIEAGTKNILAALAEKYGTVIDYEGLVFDGQADVKRMKEIAIKLVDEKVDLVISIATPPTVAMKDILEAAHINMIFRAVSDPIRAGVIDSFEHPGEYITGTSDSLDGAELAEVMLAVMPTVKTVGLLYSKNEFSSMKPIEEAKAFLDNLDIEWVEATPTAKEEVRVAAEELIVKEVEAVLTPTDNTVMSAELEISPVFTAAGIPQFTGSHAFTINGAFMGLGSFYKDGDQECQGLVEKVLIEGVKPDDMPVIRSPHTFAAINNQICEALKYDRENLEARIAGLGKKTLFLDSQAEFDLDSNL